VAHFRRIIVGAILWATKFRTSWFFFFFRQLSSSVDDNKKQVGAPERKKFELFGRSARLLDRIS
jgi:hypothetical protein